MAKSSFRHAQTEPLDGDPCPVRVDLRPAVSAYIGSFTTRGIGLHSTLGYRSLAECEHQQDGVPPTAPDTVP